MKTKWAVRCTAVMVIGFFIFIAVKQLTTPNELTANEMTKQIEQIYSAQVQTLKEQGDHYLASFNKDGSIYEVNINPITGQYSDLQLVHKKQVLQTKEETEGNNNTTEESPVREQPLTTNPPSTKAETEQPKPLLSQQQAITIALKEVPGEVDSVEFEKSVDGGSYFIEIEQENEVTVQVHAITGKILSIQYDD